MHNSLQENKK